MKTTPIQRIKDAHYGFWFTQDTMRCWRSRVASVAYLNEATNEAYFVSSEQQSGWERLYSVRVCNMADGDIDTVGVFQGYTTSAAATHEAKRLAACK